MWYTSLIHQPLLDHSTEDNQICTCTYTCIEVVHLLFSKFKDWCHSHHFMERMCATYLDS
jgi:hypothetical protein